MTANGNMSGSFRKMKAAVLRQVKGRMEVEDIIFPNPKFGEVLIKVSMVAAMEFLSGAIEIEWIFAFDSAS